MMNLLSIGYHFIQRNPIQYKLNSVQLLTEQIATILKSGNYSISDLLQLQSILQEHISDPNMTVFRFFTIRSILVFKINELQKTI